MTANTMQVGGGHYKNTEAYEHWDWVADCQLDYFAGNITKYVMRHRKKNGVEDLRKAGHYLNKLIELAEAPSAKGVRSPSQRLMLPNITLGYMAERTRRFASANELTEEEAEFCFRMAKWTTVGTLRVARQVLERMVGELVLPPAPVPVEDSNRHALQPEE